jgi:hypothetical protein
METPPTPSQSVGEQQYQFVLPPPPTAPPVEKVVHMAGKHQRTVKQATQVRITPPPAYSV